ncbi:MAG: hypothetical protein L3K07_03795, partial [Thermoplasmata archaeon]|nr:hypothetical protein [Thermoplasmata archaeon]
SEARDGRSDPIREPGPLGSAPKDANRRVLNQARRRGRPAAQTRDLIALVAEETQGAPVEDLHGMEEVLVA